MNSYILTLILGEIGRVQGGMPVKLVHTFWIKVPYFVSCALGIVSKKALPNPKSSRFTPMISSESFIVSALTCLIRF